MLRPYQIEAMEEIRRAFSKNKKKIILHLACGAGKTMIFCETIKSAISKGTKCLVVVRRRLLVENASQRLTREGVPHGVIMANHKGKNEEALCQVASIDTLNSRKIKPDAKLIIIDEAHDAVDGKYKDFVSQYKDAYIISCTATPYCNKSMRHLGDEVVHPIDLKGLTSKEYLVPPKYFAPSAPDLTGVHTRNGDFVNEEIEERMNVLTGDIVSHWEKIGENRPTLCFAVNIKHSKSIVDQFLKAGIPAEHVEGNNSFEERQAAIKRLETGEIKILSNVGILNTGVDIPFASAIIMARPTKSYILYIQTLGRGTRCSPGKKDFIVLDHASNVIRHGFMDDEPQVDLDGKPPKKKQDLQFKICQKCYTVYVGTRCHICGDIPERKDKSEIEFEEGVLTELKNYPIGKEVSLFIKRMREVQKRKGYKRWWIYYKVKEVYGEGVANIAFAGMIKQREYWLKYGQFL